MSRFSSDLGRQAIEYAELIAASSDCYNLLETLCICFPARLSGSINHQKAVEYLESYGATKLPQGCCYSEHVDGVPSWNRGANERCELTIRPDPSSLPEPYPLSRTIRVLSNGLSVGTPPSGLSGDIIVVSSWEELEERGTRGLLRNRVVLYNFKSFYDYTQQSRFRGRGAIEAARYGALAAITRTLAPDNSTSGVHTGQMLYCEGVSKIPGCCCSIEDAELITRLLARGHEISARLILPCYQLPDVTSKNVIYEIKGSELPEEIIIIGGHTDSW
jgi:carboxypeptidase Q